LYAFVAASLAATKKHVKGGDKAWNEDPSARASVWNRSDELVNRPDVTKMITNPLPVVRALKRKIADVENENIAKKSKLETTPEQSMYSM